jgi:hypothetical protein
MEKPLKSNICKNCTVEFFTKHWKNQQFCTKSCAQQFKGKDKSWLEKRKKTCLKKYGNEIAIMSDQVRKKYKDTLFEKYGTISSPFENEEIKNKANETNIKKYGDKYASKNKDIADKISKSLKGRILPRNNFIDIKWEKLLVYQEETGMVPLFNKEFLIENKLNWEFGNKFLFQCNKCLSITEVGLGGGYLPCCHKCSNFRGYSLIEEELIVFLKQHIDIDISNLNRRDILPSRLELDIYLPDFNIAIEVNGVYWHSESMGKYRDYHLHKTIKCNEKNLELIHIFDFEWLKKKEIIKSMLLNKLGKTPNRIYARKCEIREISETHIVKEFLIFNHIQGYTHASVNLGLYYNNELVACMTFGKNRFKKQSNEWEMVRFCNKLNTNIIGGASRLFKYFNKNLNSNKLNIISFSDRRFFNGGLYKQLGFDFDKFTKPSYFYWKNERVYNRMSYQKHKLHKLLEIFDNNKTEYQNMLDNKFIRIWDCGNSKWTYNQNKKGSIS